MDVSVLQGKLVAGAVEVVLLSLLQWAYVPASLVVWCPRFHRGAGE